MDKTKAGNSFRKEQIINKKLLFCKTKKRTSLFGELKEKKYLLKNNLCLEEIINHRESDSKNERNL